MLTRVVLGSTLVLGCASVLAADESTYVDVFLREYSSKAEMNFRLAGVLAPGSYDEAFLKSILDGRPISELGIAFTKQYDAVQRSPKSGVCDPSKDPCSWTFSAKLPGVEGTFYTIDPDSEIARTYGAGLDDPITRLEHSEPPSTEAQFVAVPQHDRVFVDGMGEPRLGVQGFQPIDLDPALARHLKLVADDISVHGQSIRAFKVPEDVDEAALQKLYGLVKSTRSTSAGSGGWLPPVPRKYSASELRGVEVEASTVTQMGQSSSCGEADAAWPVDVDAVAEVLNRNLDVVRRVGLATLRRANIVVVDSGVPKALASAPGFRPLLFVDPVRALNPARFTKDASLAESCWIYGGSKGRGVAAYGYVARAAAGDACIAADPLEHLAPLPAVEASPLYAPDHGGVVAMLAGGGPALSGRVADLHRLIGISFARINHVEEGRVVADGSDVEDALAYAKHVGAAVVNVSLRVSASHVGPIADAIDDFGDAESGLVVASAGNAGLHLLPGSDSFPAAAAGSLQEAMLVVGGVQRRDGKLQYYGSYSAALVDLASPATEIASWSGDGNLACHAGTSVAAPQVSFVAAVVTALGYASPAQVRRRILATADELEVLADKVRHGRVLNVVNALDVFADLVWLRGDVAPKRVRIVGAEAGQAKPFIQVCERDDPVLSAADGWTDPARLIYWHQRSAGKAEVWVQEADGEPTALEQSCHVPPDSRIRVRDLETGAETSVSLANIDRIVPTQLRAGLR